MVALDASFWIIVGILTLAIWFFIWSDTYEDVKQLFVNSKPVIEIAYQPVSCPSVGAFSLQPSAELSAEVARPAFSKRTELVPVFIFRDKVSLGTPNKIILETEEQHTVTVKSETVSVPTEGEHFTVALLTDDQKCSELAKTKGSFERFAAECAKLLVQPPKTLTIEKNQCVAPREERKAQLIGEIIIAVTSSLSKKDTECGVAVTVKNTGKTNWESVDKVKLLLFCKPYDFPQILPLLPDKYVDLKAGTSEAFIYAQGCTKSLERYKVELWANCKSNNCDKDVESRILDRKEFICK